MEEFQLCAIIFLRDKQGGSKNYGFFCLTLILDKIMELLIGHVISKELKGINASSVNQHGLIEYSSCLIKVLFFFFFSGRLKIVLINVIVVI